MTSGIYTIRNKINGKIYIGSSVVIERRWTKHKHDLEHGKHHSGHLQNSWDKHGSAAFLFDIVEIVIDTKQLVKREQVWIDNLKPEFNIHPNARSPIGVKRTEETKEKLRAIKRPYLAERNKTPEMRKKASSRAIARNKSPLMKAAVSNRPSPLLGYKHTADSKAKITASKLGKKRPDLRHGPDGRFISTP